MLEDQISKADDVDMLLTIMPPHIREAIKKENYKKNLIEVILDLGRFPEARFPDSLKELSDMPVTREDIDYVISRIGRFTEDNRAGIERTLHRISAIRNRIGTIIGLTCRVGRAIYGTIDIVQDVIERGDSLLLLGRPGVGKTTLLRESARVLADNFGKRVVIVDTSNEIGGDGDIPHPGVGRARRMQVPTPERQHAVMIEAVENHMPEVIVIDEIGTQAEAMAARTIAERGVQLIATAHGNNLDNLLQNPTLSDLVGGIQAVTLSDEEAKRRGTQKTVLERKGPPTFHVLVEIQNQDQLAVYHNVAKTVDATLRKDLLQPEIRIRTEDGKVEIQQETISSDFALDQQEPSPIATNHAEMQKQPSGKSLRIFTYGVNRDRLEKAIKKFQAPAYIVKDLDSADVVLAHKSQRKIRSRRLRTIQSQGIPFHLIRSNTIPQMEHFLHSLFYLGERSQEDKALQVTKVAISEVFEKGHSIELTPKNSYIRSLQHQLAERYGLSTKSKGKEPNRRVIIYPT